jgi:hypothetical protein
VHPTDGADELVLIQRAGAKQFRKPALPNAALKFHLKETILRVHKALRAKKVFGRVGVDVGHAELVADDLDIASEAGQLERAGSLRELFTRDDVIGAAGGDTQHHDDDERNDKDATEDFHWLGFNTEKRRR